ncbi:Programmed cell death protein 7 [Portunus trituberculatus]|uniref:Programmed cell death protein 7 n=1 Tax=Portunus trituberculatus TaxID=210409 RepID=A0A5B7DSI9_PORTR|nr:Programmed cell death protein 7 [Portunus trituberculatus]
MSQEPKGGMRESPLLPSQPLAGQRVTHGQFLYIPEQERSFGYSQHSIPPPHIHPTASLGNNSRPHSFPPRDHSLPPPHLHGNSPPMFARPPPMPPRFSQPPPAMSCPPNIPYQASFQNPMMTPGECNPLWLQRGPPPVLPCPPMQGDKAPLSGTHSGVSKGTVFRDSKEQEDDLWLEEFEKRVKSCPPSPPSPAEPNTAKKIVKLAEVQRLVVESQSLREQLCVLEKELTQVIDSADEEEWNRLVQQSEGVKASLNKILDKFQDREFVEHTKILLKQRRAKRDRVKRRKKERRLEQEELKRKREEEEAKIDAWRAKLQREEDTKRREEAVKLEADSVLGEVRQKQSEGQRMLQLLEALADLRCTRATQAASQGRPTDAEADQRFTTTTEMLSKMVKEQLKEYELEEQTLRVMMEESASHRSAALSAKGDANFARYKDAIWKLLFGPSATKDEDAGLSLETLVLRRQEWDQYLVEQQHPLASAVPLSWVLPPEHPPSSWAAFKR